MQKTFLSLILSGMVSYAGAQEKSVLLFGNLGGSTITQSDPSINRSAFGGVHISPGIGYQVSHHWTLGVEGIFNYMGGSANAPTPYMSYPMKMRTMSAGGGVFARYTVPITSLFFFYTQADATYARSRTSDVGMSYPASTSNELSVRLSPAIGMNIKNGYAINFTFGNLGFNHNSSPSFSYRSSVISYNFSQGLSVGISKNFIHHPRPVIKTAEKEGPESE